MTYNRQEFDPNIPVSEDRIKMEIEIIDATNQRIDKNWGEYIKETVALFNVRQEIFNPAMEVQMTRLAVILPDLQIAEGLQTAELPELKRAAVVAIRRALMVRRESFRTED